MKRCKFFLSPNGFKCGSYAFNLDEQGIDQGEFCDVHYWQNRCEKAEAAALSQPAAAPAVSVIELDAIYAKEIERVSTVPYDSNAICRWFYRNLRDAITAPKATP